MKAVHREQEAMCGEFGMQAPTYLLWVRYFVLQECYSIMFFSFSRGSLLIGCSVEVKSVLPGGRQEPLPHHGLGGVVRQLEVVHAGVDAGVGAVGGVDFPHESQSGVQIGQPA